MPFGCGRNWAAYSPEELAEKKRKQAEVCRRNNLARSKEMRTRIAREMGLKNKGRKHSESHRINAKKWMHDPVKMAKYREKQRLITQKWQTEDPEKAAKCHSNIKPGNSYKKTSTEEDWWARNYKVSRHRHRVAEARSKLAQVGLDLPDMNVTEEYLDEVDDFFAEVW